MEALIEKVHQIDPKAADYLIMLLEANLSPGKPLYFVPTSDHLACAFEWKGTPQGHKYWEGIAEQVCQP